MGKYMRKAKITGEVAVMEVAHQSSLGVRTRARTLALQRLQTSSSPSPDHVAEPDDGSYLQLRSRRLEKPPMAGFRPKDAVKDSNKSGHEEKNASEPTTHKPRLAACSANSGSAGSVASAKCCSKKWWREMQEPVSEASPDNDGIEASFGENTPDFEQGDRNTRETTPCSLIRDADSVRTPESTTRMRTTSCRRTHAAAHRSIPTTDEMEEFFSGAERLQQRIFTQKYNFDPVNDCPLPGRYEWVRMDA